ncbi:OTU domain-containing protein [Vitis vinifera]|uniref:OTU domain-containing protein n=1 Tax=Vitis vinifera TaxID=29760 RepID=A0A438IKN2_VITVI|nr:OTU domain-containing protein [Vitis vinifera]
MITYEQDPDVVRWGLQLFDGDPFSNCGYGGTIVQNDVSYYDGPYFKEDHYDNECSNVENDEIIAHALQEELSQLAVDEAAGLSHEVVEDLQFGWMLSLLCSIVLISFITCRHESGQEDTDDMGLSSSCSSPDEKSYNGEDWSYSLDLTDEYALDGEVGKILNQMVPVPHVPKINGEIPSLDEATLDHQRLLDRLQLFDLVELKVQGDGNCQFRSLSDQVYCTPEHHQFIRQQVVNQLKSYPEIYEGYVPMAYDDYLEKMSKTGEWGDHVTLQAAADLVCFVSSFHDHVLI